MAELYCRSTLFSSYIIKFVVYTVILSLSVPIGGGYKILAIFPFPGVSHHAVFTPLLIELTRRGHDVTVYNTSPKPLQIAGLKEYDLKPCFGHVLGTANESVWRLDRIGRVSSAVESVKDLYTLMPTVEQVLNCKPLLDLASSSSSNGRDVKYDLLLTQYFVADWPLGYAKKFNLPIVAICTGTGFMWHSHRTALPEYPSYMRYRDVVIKNPPLMDFRERLENLYTFVLYRLFYQYYAYTVTDRIFVSLFGTDDFPGVDEIAASNTSLVLVNSHFSINAVRPFVPAVVEIGGISIGQVSPLPKDVEKFINQSQDGVIYFSMGSVLPSTTFPAQAKEAFLKVFSKLSVGVIWKFEQTDLQGKPKNVFISKWLPQRSVLSHPKLRLFISHCGQTSMSEAIYDGVPMLGIPIFADQKGNIDTFVLAGAGEKLDFNNLSEELILEKINLMLREKRYKLNAQKLSAIFRDRPMSPMDTAMYWIEYVIRYKGAHHLRSPAVRMPWYRYFLIDVILVVTVTMFIFVFIVYFTFKITFQKVATSLFKRSPIKVKVN